MRQLSGSVTSSRPIRHSGALAATLLVIVGLLFCSMQGSAAQGVAKQAKVAILSPFSPPEPGIEAFVRELTRLGWVEGQNLSTEVTSVHGKLERLPAGAAELMSNKPDVIFAPGEQGLRAAKRASSATPIVTVACNPLDRLIVSLAAPGGSATGLSCIHSELAGKRLEMLKELVPSLAQVAVLYNPSDPNKHLEFEQLRTAGERLQVTVRAFEMADANGIEEAFASAVSNRAQAVMVLVDAFTIFHRQKIAALALDRRLPSVFGFKEFVDAGGLISYGASREALFRRAASYVDRILKGAKAGELPVEEPTIFELYISRRTADALGLTIPPTLLARADEVIE